MDLLLGTVQIISQVVFVIALIFYLKRASYALDQIIEKIADIPATLSEVMPDNSDPALVAEIAGLLQRMTNLESFTDSRYKKMAAIDNRLGKHNRESAEEEDDGNLQIDYEALAQAVKSGQNVVIEPEPPKAQSEAELIRLELGL